MPHVIGALVGLLWGSLAALCNYGINRAMLKKNDNAAVMLANVGRLAVDLIALGAVFLLRKRLPFGFEACIIATAVSLSLLNVALSYWVIRPKK